MDNFRPDTPFMAQGCFNSAQSARPPALSPLSMTVALAVGELFPILTPARNQYLSEPITAAPSAFAWTNHPPSALNSGSTHLPLRSPLSLPPAWKIASIPHYVHCHLCHCLNALIFKAPTRPNATCKNSLALSSPRICSTI